MEKRFPLDSRPSFPQNCLMFAPLTTPKPAHALKARKTISYQLAAEGSLIPLIGAAGVAALPEAARAANQMATEENPHNNLLMHAMGPNVAGLIATAITVGILWAFMV